VTLWPHYQIENTSIYHLNLIAISSSISFILLANLLRKLFLSIIVNEPWLVLNLRDMLPLTLVAEFLIIQ